MTNIAKKDGVIKITSKKKLQIALQNEIEKIDARLASLGLPSKIVYKVTGAITSHEAPNNISNI